MSATSPSFYEPRVSTAYLSRLDLIDPAGDEESSVALALRILHSAGLAAEESKLEPGGIVGGVQSFDTAAGKAFKEAFLISPHEGTYRATVTGPGNFCNEEVVASMQDGARSVIKIYRKRGRIDA
jgi:hypothetical protein